MFFYTVLITLSMTFGPQATLFVNNHLRGTLDNVI